MTSKSNNNNNKLSPFSFSSSSTNNGTKTIISATPSTIRTMDQSKQQIFDNDNESDKINPVMDVIKQEFITTQIKVQKDNNNNNKNNMLLYTINKKYRSTVGGTIDATSSLLKRIHNDSVFSMNFMSDFMFSNMGKNQIVNKKSPHEQNMKNQQPKSQPKQLFDKNENYHIPHFSQTKSNKKSDLSSPPLIGVKVSTSHIKLPCSITRSEIRMPPLQRIDYSIVSLNYNDGGKLDATEKLSPTETEKYQQQKQEEKDKSKEESKLLSYLSDKKNDRKNIIQPLRQMKKEDIKNIKDKQQQLQSAIKSLSSTKQVKIIKRPPFKSLLTTSNKSINKQRLLLQKSLIIYQSNDDDIDKSVKESRIMPVESKKREGRGESKEKYSF